MKLESVLIPGDVGAVFVPALCISWDEKRLSNLCEESMNVTADFLKKHKDITLILSHSNRKYWKLEEKYKLDYLREKGIVPKNIIHLVPEEEVSNTYLEIDRLAAVIGNFNKVAVIAEKWHMPRVISALEKRFKSIIFYRVNFDAKKYGPLNTKPSYKGLFASTKLSWIVYNIVCRLLTPFIVSSS